MYELKNERTLLHADYDTDEAKGDKKEEKIVGT